MKKQEWIEQIQSKCEQVGTYKSAFDDVIESLATILEQRDEAFYQYVQTGSHPVITHTNKAGATNACKNPILVMWCDLNTQALGFWRDLGLTPSGLRKINEELLLSKQGTSFGELLKNELSK